MLLQRRLRDDSQWRTVLSFEPIDLEAVQAGAAQLSMASDVSWRIVGVGDRVLLAFDGRRWRNDAGALAPSVWWTGPRAGDDTQPAPLDDFPDTVPLRGGKV